MTTAVATTESPHNIAAAKPKASILAKMADRFSVEPNKLLETLKATAFKAQGGVSNEQMIALLIVADQYKLNPFTKEVFAFPDKGGIVPVVSVDGWARILNEHPQFDGIAFHYDEAEGAMTCTIHRKDRSHPTQVTEYMAECKRGTQPWNSHPRRMLRHKALIQGARVAFGFAGIYDEDEAQRIVHGGMADEVRPESGSLSAVRSAIAGKLGGEVVDMETGETQQKVLAKTAADYIGEIDNATSAETAALVLDEAKDVLTPEEWQKVSDAYNMAWTEGAK